MNNPLHPLASKRVVEVLFPSLDSRHKGGKHIFGGLCHPGQQTSYLRTHIPICGSAKTPRLKIEVMSAGASAYSLLLAAKQ